VKDGLAEISGLVRANVLGVFPQPVSGEIFCFALPLAK
jgi:hypothetical protein